MSPPPSPGNRLRIVRRAAALGGWMLVVVGLAGLTGWNVTYSGHLELGRQAYTRGDLTAALQEALDHLDRRPWSREASLLAARCLSRLDHADAAEPYYREAGALDLADQQIRAYGLVRGNRRQQAIEAYERILDRWPDNVTAMRRLAAVQLSENNVPQLNALVERLIRAPGGAVIGRTIQGVVAYNDRNHEGLVDAFEGVLREDPELRIMPLPRTLFWRHFSESLIKCGRLEDVGRYLGKVVDETRDAPLMSNLGQSYLLRGMLDEAERCFRQAAEWDPASYFPPYNLGKIELQRRRPDLAVVHFEAARQRAPRREEILFSLISVYRLLQRPADAERVQKLVDQVRADAKPARDPKEPWPRHAL